MHGDDSDDLWWTKSKNRDRVKLLSKDKINRQLDRVFDDRTTWQKFKDWVIRRKNMGI